ncbi:MAG: hypothetical protein U9Q15_03830 [Patescibacteria group bacterium]|nr:hypothetical protein [Patescibacteria group bacterium]
MMSYLDANPNVTGSELQDMHEYYTSYGVDANKFLLSEGTPNVMSILNDLIENSSFSDASEIPQTTIPLLESLRGMSGLETDADGKVINDISIDPDGIKFDIDGDNKYWDLSAKIAPDFETIELDGKTYDMFVENSEGIMVFNETDIKPIIFEEFKDQTAGGVASETLDAIKNMATKFTEQ